MITDKDIEKLKKVFATKDDLIGMEKRFDKKFATKDDLKRFATKKDLKKELSAYATKDDLKKLATKDDLKAYATREDLKKELSAYATKNDLLRLKGDLLGEMSKLRHGIIEDLEVFFHEQMMPIFEQHERQITRIEKHVKLPPLVD